MTSSFFISRFPPQSSSVAKLEGFIHSRVSLPLVLPFHNTSTVPKRGEEEQLANVFRHFGDTQTVGINFQGRIVNSFPKIGDLG